MPRGTKKNANPHNSRHENGIVAPGRRITKQRSNGQLSGSPDGKLLANPPPVPSPTATQPRVQLSEESPNNHTNGSVKDSKDLPNGVTRAEDLDARFLDDLSEESESQQNGFLANKTHDQNHRKLDVNAAIISAVRDGSTLKLALTILRSCPIADTLAILVFLLSLPPAFLTLTNAVFAMLTFMPPAGSFSSLPTFSDITSGSPGAPSLTTICITDFVGISLWLIIFEPVQLLALDLTQAVVATTLGGGYSSRKAGSDTTLLCMFIVSTTHLTRYKEQIRRVFGYDVLRKWISWLGEPDFVPPTFTAYNISSWSIANWFRILISLHILVQGITRMVRRWYFRRDYAQATSFSKKSDPEAVAGSQIHAEGVNLAEQIVNLPNPLSELATKSSLQNLRETLDKHSSGKRKKRQGTLVRSQQPLWAAFAATKVTVIREYEQSQAISETAKSNAVDAKNLGNAPFVLEEGKIWITLVRSSSFFIDTSYFPLKPSSDQGAKCLDAFETSAVDRSNPFFVRINGAEWMSIKFHSISTESSGNKGRRWTGEVYGLSPASTYQCSFVRSEDDVVIHSAIVSTPSSPVTEQATAQNVTPSRQKTRPSSPTSPITTLKNSIVASEAILNDSNAHQKRNRKENRTASASSKKEVDILNSSLSKIGSNDKSQHTRQLQHTQHVRQAEESMASICDELDSLENLPETDSDEWKSRKSAWDDERRRQSSIRDEVDQHRDLNHRDASSVQTEALTVQQKRERLQARSSKLGDQHERLQSASTHGVDERERRDTEHTIRKRDRDANEALHKDQTSSLVHSVQELNYYTCQSWHQTQVLETAFEQHKITAINDNTRPLTPEGDLPGTVPSTAPATSSSFRFPAFGSSNTNFVEAQHKYGSSNATSLRHEGMRARSTSLLSGNSIYTDFSDPDPAPPMPSRSTVEAMRVARQHSESSGSAPGSNPMSPINPGGFAWKEKEGNPSLN